MEPCFATEAQAAQAERPYQLSYRSWPVRFHPASALATVHLEQIADQIQRSLAVAAMEQGPCMDRRSSHLQQHAQFLRLARWLRRMSPHPLSFAGSSMRLNRCAHR